MPKNRCGIDICSGHLKTATGDGSSISSVKVITLPDNLVVDGKVVSASTVSDLLRQERLGAKECALVLHSPQCHVRRTTMPAMGVKELQLNLPYEFQDRIEDGKDKYRFDYAMLEMLRDEDGQPHEMDLLAAVTRADYIDECDRMLKAGGLRLKSAAPDVCAYMNIIAMSPDPTQDFCFVDISSTVTRVYLFPHGRYEVTRIIDFGIDSVAAALAGDLGIDLPLAKTYLQSDFEGCQSNAAVMEKYEALLIELERIINFFSFTYRDSDLHSVYYGGVGASLDVLIDAIAKGLQIAFLSVAAIIPHGPGVDERDLVKVPAAAGSLLTQGRK